MKPLESPEGFEKMAKDRPGVFKKVFPDELQHTPDDPDFEAEVVRKVFEDLIPLSRSSEIDDGASVTESAVVADDEGPITFDEDDYDW